MVAHKKPGLLAMQNVPGWDVNLSALDHLVGTSLRQSEFARAHLQHKLAAAVQLHPAHTREGEPNLSSIGPGMDYKVMF